MTKTKGLKNKKKDQANHSSIEEIVEQEIEFNCPVRGKIKQKVKIKKLKSRVTESKPILLSKGDLDIVDSDDTIYGNTLEDGDE